MSESKPATPSSSRSRSPRTRCASTFRTITWATSWTASGPENGTICDVEIGYRSVTVCHLGSIALRLGIPLDWDPEAEKFVGPRADKGNAMISREMRSPWRLEV